MIQHSITEGRVVWIRKYESRSDTDNFFTARGCFTHGKGFCSMCPMYVPSYLMYFAMNDSLFIESIEGCVGQIRKYESISHTKFFLYGSSGRRFTRFFRSVSFAFTVFDTNYDPAIDTIGASAHYVDLISDRWDIVCCPCHDISWIFSHFAFKTLTHHYTWSNPTWLHSVYW